MLCITNLRNLLKYSNTALTNFGWLVLFINTILERWVLLSYLYLLNPQQLKPCVAQAFEI